MGGLRKGFYGICYDLAITAVLSIYIEESDKILCIKNSQIHTGYLTKKKNKTRGATASPKRFVGLRVEMLNVLQILYQERKLIYTETIVQDVIAKYFATCCGKYKQFEGKSDFISATPFQYLEKLCR